MGVASGRWDALVFLGGAMGGSILFNETFGAVKGLYTWGASGVQFAWQNVGVSSAGFAFLFVLVAIGCFWGSEYIEKRRGTGGTYFNSSFLKAFSVALVVLAAGLMIFHGTGSDAPAAASTKPQSSEAAILATVEAAEDHIEPEDLADRLMAGEKGLLLVDTRPAAEFEAFHIRGAVNIAMTDLPAVLVPNKNVGLIVLYSNGMTHPAEARDSLARMGFGNAYMLTDGLQGFIDRCLKPVSLHLEPLSAPQAAKINAWRRYFHGLPAATAVPPTTLPISKPVSPKLPGLVEPAWLAENLGKPDIRILDVREQPRYNTSHLPGSVCVSPEHFRGVINGVSAMLLPPDMLARHMSLMGIIVGEADVQAPVQVVLHAPMASDVFQQPRGVVGRQAGDVVAVLRAGLASDRSLVQCFMDEMISELAKGNRLEFRDFGVFEPKQRGARHGQNPKTLERVQVPAKRTVKFKLGRVMKQKVEKPGARK